MGHREHGVYDAGTWEPGYRASDTAMGQAPWPQKDPFHISVPIFSSHKGLSVFFFFLPPPPSLLMPKSGSVLDEWGPGYPLPPYELRRGSGLGAKTMAQKEPARPPDPFSGREL